MSTAFSEIISGQAPAWSLEVPAAADLGVMARVGRPATAFMLLNFGPAATAYLDSLDYKSDFDKGPRSRMLEEHIFSICGWRRDAADSSVARRLFEKRAAQFFPDRNGRAEMLSTLSGAFAGLAAGLDRNTLRFKARALRHDTRLDIHEDDGSDFSAAANLRDKATIVFPPGSCPRSARKRIPVSKYQDEKIIYDPEGCDLAQGRHLPRRSLGVWTEKQPHAAACGVEMTRVAVFAFADNIHRGQAYSAPPKWPRRTMDWIFNHALA